MPTTSPAPSARPVIAWAAMAIASSTNDRKPHRVIASWWVAIWSAAPPDPSATAYVVTSSAARSVRVRTTRATPARAAARTPGTSGLSGRAVPAGAADDDRDQRGRRGHLRDHRPPGGAGDSQTFEAGPVDRPGAVHEEHVEHDVEGVAADGDDQRRPGVLETAQDTGRGEHDQQRHHAEEGDPQVRRGVPGDLRVHPERADQWVGEHDPRDGDGDAEADGEPDAVETEGEGSAQVAGAQSPGDPGGGAVGEEHTQAHRGLQDHRGDPEPGELGGAEVSHHRGVGEEEQRLGHQREERRHRQPKDLPVHRPVAPAHRLHPSVAGRRAGPPMSSPESVENPAGSVDMWHGERFVDKPPGHARVDRG